MSEKKRLLIVDDEANIRRVLQVAFEKRGWLAMTAESAEEALRLLPEHPVDVVLTDITMPGINGCDLQLHVRERWPDLPVVLMTAYGTIPQAIKAIRNGAFEFVTKPFDLEALAKVVQAAAQPRSAPKTAKRGKGAKSDLREGFVARSTAMREVLATVEQVADSRATVLVTGESGTGKEVVSRLIHQLSPRSTRPFVAVSCAALPETLLESELFGYEKGAFTGASGSKPGRFELADAGTLFLDEIGEIPPSIQVKLLRVLQEREFERLGATKPTRVDVRLIAATNRDLQEAVDEGTFRLDLMYRLQVVEVRIPALRERPEDILPLAEEFLRRASTENGRVLTQVGEDALQRMLAYPWPGNVRELENAMERAVVLAPRDQNVLSPSQLPRTILRVA